jgi:SpoVK/Ycf46/Vps4 family AAA+-type ATPase
MLREYLLWLRHRQTVVSSWGGRATGGPIALFAGPSGTGKTLAASVIASELGWPLYRVDLARLVSKYVGETEKNIGRLLDGASGKPLVLQFDEVDALMSRRGEVKDPRDRYANMEVSYLLTRLEEHDGPCVLTTNLRAQIDKAFFRRFQMVVEFPRPDAPARARLWDIMLPPRGPRAPNVDLQLLSSVNMTGGSIRNAALHAAYLAAEDAAPIDLGHIAIGVFREFAKERPRVMRADLGSLARHLPQTIRTSEAA